MRWLLALHLLAVIMWAGPLLLLLQILTMHAGEEGAGRDAFTRIEQRLFGSVVNPGAAIVLVSGLLIFLLAPGTYLKAGWFHAKLLLVVGLFVLHIRVFRHMQALHAGRDDGAAKQFQRLYALTALGIILVVILVTVKPF
jgi:protoporphyrinogen IX oxidase